MCTWLLGVQFFGGQFGGGGGGGGMEDLFGGMGGGGMGGGRSFTGGAGFPGMGGMGHMDGMGGGRRRKVSSAQGFVIARAGCISAAGPCSRHAACAAAWVM
jgi:hypothetical protein